MKVSEIKLMQQKCNFFLTCTFFIRKTFRRIHFVLFCHFLCLTVSCVSSILICLRRSTVITWLARVKILRWHRAFREIFCGVATMPKGTCFNGSQFEFNEFRLLKTINLNPVSFAYMLLHIAKQLSLIFNSKLDDMMTIKRNAEIAFDCEISCLTVAESQ